MTSTGSSSFSLARSRNRAAIAAAWLFSFVAANLAMAEDISAFLGIEVRGDPMRLRFTLDISRTVPFNVELTRGTRRLRIDLPAVTAPPDVCTPLLASPYVAACSAGRLIFGYYSVAVTLSFCGAVDLAVMEEAMGDMPARLYIDVVPAFLRCE